MITSEVQRTLVKSPPELWAELSDPESLARHLGDFGEITITRTEPENLVEWEAEGTTGTVEIKPSGWGTRVTLTVLRETSAEPGDAVAQEAAVAEEPAAEKEVPEPAKSPPETSDSYEPGEPAEAPEAAGGAADDAQAAVAEQSPADEPQDEPVARVEDTAPAADPALPHELRAGEDGAPERKPAPATEAARRATGWVDRAEAAAESEALTAREPDPPAAEPEGLQAWALQSGTEELLDVARSSPDAGAPKASAPEPRRGFFARLFGQRCRPQDERMPDTVVAIAAERESVEPTIEPGEELETQEETAAALEPDDAIEPDAGIEPEDAIEPDAAIEEAYEVVDAGEELGDAGEEIADARDEISDAAGDSFAVAGETGPGPSASIEPEEASAGDAAPSTSPPPVQDLAAELRAAEEVAAEEVEAVLTAVLDRLGSAHHRPFSRS